MRYTNSIIIRISALLITLALLMTCGFAESMDGTLTLGMISVKSTSLNPLQAEEREFQSLTALIYEGLFALDDNYMPVNCLAERDSYEGSSKTWMITMRRNVYFHDGTPCTAYDAAATINEILRLAGEGKGQYSQLKYFISSARANDALNLEIKVTRPYYGLYYAFTFPILPQSQLTSDAPAGTGPYLVEGFEPASYLYLSANENWWNGTADTANINVLFQNTNRSLIEDYEFNRIDAAITRSASAGQYRTGLKNLNISYRTRQFEALMMNYRSFPLENENIRKAIRYAINVDAIADSVYSGTVERTNTPFPSDLWMYYNDENAFEYNPEKAKQILAAEGWGDNDGDGVLDILVDGKPKRLHLRLWTYEEPDNTVREPAIRKIADMLSEVGIETTITVLSYATAKERLNARNFDLFLVAFQMDTVPDPGFLLMSSNTCNFGNYKSDAMDSLFKNLRLSMDFSEYASYLTQIQQRYIADCPFISFYYRSGAVLTRKVFTVYRDIREPEILRGIETVGK